mgnify:CR=1 FL=1
MGSIRYYAGQVDDAKYCANLIRTAAHYGAHAVNQMAVVDFLREGERVVGAKVVNHEDGSSFNIRAKQVINATGVILHTNLGRAPLAPAVLDRISHWDWTDGLRPATDAPVWSVNTRPSFGTTFPTRFIV